LLLLLFLVGGGPDEEPVLEEVEKKLGEGEGMVTRL